MLVIPRGQRIRSSSQYTLSFIATVTRILPEMTSHSITLQTLTFDFLESPRANGLISEQMQAFDGIILDFMKEQDIPGASVAISRGEELIYCQGKYKLERDMLTFSNNFCILQMGIKSIYCRKKKL